MWINPGTWQKVLQWSKDEPGLKNILEILNLFEFTCRFSLLFVQ
jgi:hypothetical protein